MNNTKKDYLVKYSKQDTRVQLIRIFACMMVIGCHIRLSAITTDGLVDKSILFISGFFDDGVAIFFLIMGFFLFKNENVGKLLKKVFFQL